MWRKSGNKANDRGMKGFFTAVVNQPHNTTLSEDQKYLLPIISDNYLITVRICTRPMGGYKKYLRVRGLKKPSPPHYEFSVQNSPLTKYGMSLLSNYFVAAVLISPQHMGNDWDVEKFYNHFRSKLLFYCFEFLPTTKDYVVDSSINAILL